MALPKEGEQDSCDENSDHHMSIHSIEKLYYAVDVGWVALRAAETTGAIFDVLESLQFTVCWCVVITWICTEFKRHTLECVVFDWLKLVAHQRHRLILAIYAHKVQECQTTLDTRLGDQADFATSLKHGAGNVLINAISHRRQLSASCRLL